MESKINGLFPGGTNLAFIHLTGTIVSWWARIEGLMIQDIMALRTWPFSEEIVCTEPFPVAGKAVVKQWRRLIYNAFNARGLNSPNLDKEVTEAICLLDHRNSLVHSFWPYGQADPERLELSWIRRDSKQRDGVIGGSYVTTLEELDSVNTRFAHLYTAVMAASFNSHIVYRERPPEPTRSSRADSPA